MCAHTRTHAHTHMCSPASMLSAIQAKSRRGFIRSVSTGFPPHPSFTAREAKDEPSGFSPEPDLNLPSSFPAQALRGQCLHHTAHQSQENGYDQIVFSCSVVSNSFATPWTGACQAPLSRGFPRQEYWTGLPFPSPGDLSDSGINPALPALRGIFYTTGKFLDLLDMTKFLPKVCNQRCS